MAGADTMVGGLNDDTYYVDNLGDVVTENLDEGTDLVISKVTYTLSANVENLTLVGGAALNATGNTGNNTLTGNNGSNILDGGTGTDTLMGGMGNDTYIVDDTTDVVIENVNAGTDTVQASITYSLGLYVENLVLVGSAALNGTGNTQNNTLIGNSGNNILSGGAGTDMMIGGLGNDTYVVDNAGDVVTENLDEGTDLIQSSVSYTLAANVEKITLTGTGAINATGNALNNTLGGNSGNNILNGGIGADTMVGGLGNDTYLVDNAADIVTEGLNAGTDLVQSSVSYTLTANIEDLTLAGNASINATGNTLNNTLTGNSGNNTINGGIGADTMIGGLGNDTYLVDNVGDVVTEALASGSDLVQSSIHYTLGLNLENLTLIGSAAINGTGNALNNTITGNSGNNILDGGFGNDIMLGGLGNDTYVVDNVADTITEAASSGTDLVQSSISYILGAELENLTLTGTETINGSGNALNNTITGNIGNNNLNGGAGVDTLIGGLGDDTYNLNRASGSDSLIENDATVGNSDFLQFANDVRADQIWFRQVGADLEVNIIGTANKALIKDWYLGSETHIEQFKSGDGKTLTDSQVQNLVDAMAGISAAPPATTSLSTTQQSTLSPVFAASWA